MQNKTLQPYFLLALLVGAFLLAFHILELFLSPIVLAAIFSVILYPLYFRLADLLKNRTSLASFLTIVLFAVIVIVPLSFIALELLIEAQQLYASRPTQEPKGVVQPVLNSFVQRLSEALPWASGILAQFQANIDQYIRLGLNWVIQNLGAAFQGLFMLFLNAFIFFVTLYYLLRDGRKFTKKLIELSPLSDSDDTAIIDQLGLAVTSVVQGQLMMALIQGTVAGIGFALFGLPNAVLLGAVSAVAALVPTIGTALVLVPAVTYLALTGSIGSAVGLSIWGALAVGLIDNLLGPKLMSTGLHLHPLLIILAVIGGIGFFGPIGIFLGPLTMSLLIVLLSIYSDIIRASD